MGWLWWLAAPVVSTALAAVVSWQLGRPARPPSSERAVADHRRFLATLAERPAPLSGSATGTGPMRGTGQAPGSIGPTPSVGRTSAPDG